MDVEMKVRGMSCTHCENAIKEAVRNLDGVRHVEVQLNRSSVTVAYDPDQISLDTICDAIEDEGYNVDR